MNKFEMFDAIHKYKDGLSHSSTEYGKGFYTKIDKYYKDGSARYFYTKEEWDAYNKAKNAKNAEAQKRSQAVSNNKTLEDNIRKNREREEAIARENQARSEALKQQRLEEQHKKEREQSEALARALERNVNPINAQQDREKAIQEAYQREQQRRKEAQDKINDYWSNDETSPLKQAKDLHAFLDPLREDYIYLSTADPFIDKVYSNYYDTREETEVIDPETGLYLKNYEVPIEEEIQMVNPGFLYSSNTDTSITAYNSNCYACTTAMVLREKGYDVIAGRDYDGVAMDGKDNQLGITYEQMFSGNFSKWKPLDKIVSDIEAEGPGTYGDFNFKWSVGVSVELYGVEVPIPFVSADLGHSIFYKVDDNGKAHFYDCQEGKEMSISDMKELENIEFVDKTRYRYKRLDNQEIQHLEKIKSSGIIQ